MSDSPTSEIGMMYRQLLAARGVPPSGMNGENMRRIVEESRRRSPDNPLIPGLTVQGEDPPNQAAASMPTQPGVPNSGVAPPIRPAPTAPLPVPQAQQAPQQISEQSNPVTQLPPQAQAEAPQAPAPMNLGPERGQPMPAAATVEAPPGVAGQSVSATPSVGADILAALANREQYVGPPASSMTVGGPDDRFMPAALAALRHPLGGGGLDVGQRQQALNAMPPPNEPITPGIGPDGRMQLRAPSDNITPSGAPPPVGTPPVPGFANRRQKIGRERTADRK